MKKEIITNNFQETQRLGTELAHKLQGGEVICLEGDLGSGKTTFTQGLLAGLGVEGPYTSPTFLIMKHYKKEFPISNFQFPNKSQKANSQIQNIYHVDAYRIGPDDLLNLGWEEIIADKKNVVIVEWAERIKDILPEDCLKIKFEWMDEKRRKIIFE